MAGPGNPDCGRGNMSVSDDLNEIDRLLAEAEDQPPKPISRRQAIQANAWLKIRRTRALRLMGAADTPVDLARGAGFRMFPTTGGMLAALRQHVMLKMMRQAHEAELLEPGQPPASGIVGTPEW